MPQPANSLIIAVDVPAASGKGTIARALAAHFALPHMDTGSLYRAVALALLRRGSDEYNEFSALRVCDDIGALMDDPELREETVGNLASRISAFPLVRAALIDRQRAFAALPEGAVLDGRDIGTVIAPDADAKLYVTASPRVRAERRVADLAGRGLPAHFDDVLIDIEARDRRDSQREAAPLARADDAILLDTDALDRDEAVAEAIRLVEQRLVDRP